MDNYTQHDIYSITFNNQIIYIGRTTLGHHRWICHKTKARQDNLHSRAIHDFMRENTTDPETFPEFTFNIICSTKDEDVAINLERHFQEMHDVPARHTRPLQFSHKIERRGE